MEIPMTTNTANSPPNCHGSIEHVPAGSENPPLPPPDVFALERRVRLIENYISTLDDTISALGNKLTLYSVSIACGLLAAFWFFR
jgi:hypothetical protein